MKNNIFQKIKITTLALILSFSLSYVYAWTAPASNPPAGNVSAPINTSTTAQTKMGSLIISATTTSRYFADFADPSFFVQPSGNSKFFNITTTGTTTTNGLKIVNGAGVNRVLTSDAIGNASWLDPVKGRGMPLQPSVYWSSATVTFTPGTYDVLGCGGSGGYGYTAYTTARSIGGCVTLTGTTLSGSTSITVGAAGVNWVWGVVGTGGGASFIGSTRLGGGGGSGGYFTAGGNGNGTYGGAAGSGSGYGWDGYPGAGGAPNGPTTVISYTNAQYFVPSFGASTGGVVVIWGPY